jgi:formyl-CoA transferase
VVDVSLLEPLVSILGPDAALHQVSGRLQGRTGNRTSITAPRNAYETSDGEWVVLSGSTQRMTERLFDAIGHPGLKSDPRFATSADRIRNVDALDDVIAGFIRQKTLDENLAFFERHEVTVGPIYNAAQFPGNEHVREREVLVTLPDEDLGSIPMHNVTPRLSATPGAIRVRAPRIGEHNDEIYGSLGLTKRDIEALGKAGTL